MDINRQVAYQTLLKIESDNAYSNLTLNNEIAKSKVTSSGFIRNLVYGVLENKMLLDYIIDKLLKKSIKSLKINDKIILEMAIYQLGYMDSVPEYAAVNESVSMAKKYCRGRAGFINGVLRNYIRNKNNIKLPDKNKDIIKYLSVKYSFEPWIIKLWEKQYGIEETENLLIASQEKPEVSVRVNLLKITRQELIEKLRDEGIEAIESKISESALKITKGENIIENKLYQQGFYSIQDESSIKTIEIFKPEKNDIVVDVCAAPGGKTLAISEMMENQGKVLARDVYDRKLKIIQREANRLDIDIIQVKNQDATKLDENMLEKVDKVLIDVPCSGLGVIRRKPEIKYKKKSEDFLKLPEKQFEILVSSSKYVKKGGIIQYSTCTNNKDENQKVVEKFLMENSKFEKVEEKEFLPHIHGTDGFYCCKMKRKT